MPLKLFLSHASTDKPFVLELKRFLEEGRDIECWLDTYEIGYGENIVSRIQQGLERCDLVLVFLSPASIQSRWVEEEWTAAYWAQVNTGKVRLIPVLLGDCQPPAILANKKFCDLRTNQLDGMGRLKADLLRDAPRPVSGGGSTARLPNFIGREAELSALKERLTQPGAFVPVIGMPGLGKTYLAREFIRRNGVLFESVYELDCQKKNLAALTGELASQLGLRLEGEAEQVAADLRRHLAAKRCLLLLDNVDDDQPGALVPGGRAAVLATARDGTIPFLAEHPELSPPLFTDKEALELFRRVLGEVSEDAAKQLFAKLGHLPMAVAVAAGLIKHDLRHTVESLAASLPPLESLKHGKSNVGRLLAEAIAVLGESEQQLLHAMAACAPSGVRLGFAAEVASLQEGAALDALQGLYARSLVVEIDRGARRYRLHPLIREAAAPVEALRQRHGALVNEHLRNWEKSPLQHAEFLEEAEQAVGVLADGASGTVMNVALKAGNLARVLGRLTQAYEFYLRVEALATRTGRSDWLHGVIGNQAVILRDWGRLEEAMALHQKQEAICLELSDRAGLQRTYGSQALILKNWGRLDEAMAMHRKEEAICQELGDRTGLQLTYGNQALILNAWGRLEEAMVLHQKKEAICKELGDRAGLGASYGNQAVILKDSGRLEEAMALLQKQEAICQELGDRSGLQVSYGNQALILKDWGRLAEAMALHQKEEAICEELGDLAGLQASYGNQAPILQHWGRLEEAMALFQKQESICQELGDRSGLACCYANWGLLERQQSLDGTAKLRAALAIFTELKMPRERDAVRKWLGE